VNKRVFCSYSNIRFYTSNLHSTCLLLKNTHNVYVITIGYTHILGYTYAIRFNYSFLFPVRFYSCLRPKNGVIFIEPIARFHSNLPFLRIKNKLKTVKYFCKS